MDESPEASGHSPDSSGDTPPPGPRATWGPKLFAVSLVAVAVFFWWLVIYSHGVTPQH